MIVQARRDSTIPLKESFVKHYQDLLGENYAKYVESMSYYLTKAVRLNPLKNDVAKTKARLERNFTLTPIPWCPEGFWVQGERRDIGNTVEHQLGYCYIQEAASMLPPVVLQAQPGERVLDLAASPGSKTTQIAAMMSNRGLVLANDQGIRLRPLGINIQKCGCRNVVITNMDGRRLRGMQFDRILADVPCSATGTIQRSSAAAKQWQPRAAEKLHSLQLQLARNAFAALKPGGRMVYSTCTLEPLENEGVVSILADEGANVLPINLPIKRENPFLEYAGTVFHQDVKHVLRIHPYTNNTEGFFVALLEKPL